LLFLEGLVENEKLYKEKKPFVGSVQKLVDKMTKPEKREFFEQLIYEKNRPTNV
jgi:hypothetical protein